MLFQDRVKIYSRLMSDKGISHNAYAPLFYRYLWKCGVKIKPPHVTKFSHNVILQTILFFTVFAVFFSGVLVFANSLGLNEPASSQIIMFYFTSFLVSVTYGVIVSLYILQVQKKHRIPNWSELN